VFPGTWTTIVMVTGPVAAVPVCPLGPGSGALLGLTTTYCARNVAASTSPARSALGSSSIATTARWTGRSSRAQSFPSSRPWARRAPRLAHRSPVVKMQ
jgi:hypothetical protein